MKKVRIRFPSIRLHLRELPDITCVSHEVITSKQLLRGVACFVGILTHRSCLGIVVCGVQIEIAQVLGGVLTNTQVADGGSCFGVNLHTRLVYVEVAVR